ncbi:hypothetical protein QQX98_006590 [Neonectria punicea]|uniref:Uncharacterized protein n=1 Tax=Neonectria punicea TaxID=979145 RepID=A0ABR1H0F0_9HYPO
MREFYITKIRLVISYACGAWFQHLGDLPLKWGISKLVLRKLRSIQYGCLIASPSPIELALSEPGYDTMDKITNTPHIALNPEKPHPFKKLETVVRQVEREACAALLNSGKESHEEGSNWSNPVVRNRAINKCAAKRAYAQ